MEGWKKRVKVPAEWNQIVEDGVVTFIVMWRDKKYTKVEGHDKEADSKEEMASKHRNEL